MDVFEEIKTGLMVAIEYEKKNATRKARLDEEKGYVIAALKNGGQQLIDQAETICANFENLSDIDIRIQWDPSSSAELQIEKNYVLGCDYWLEGM